MIVEKDKMYAFLENVNLSCRRTISYLDMVRVPPTQNLLGIDVSVQMRYQCVVSQPRGKAIRKLTVRSSRNPHEIPDLAF